MAGAAIGAVVSPIVLARKRSSRVLLSDRVEWMKAVRIEAPDATTRLCAVVSSALSTCQSAEALGTMLLEHCPDQTFDDIRLELRGRLHPPVATVIAGDVMIICWRGSKSPMDFLMDVAAAPVASPYWEEMAPEIAVHGGMLGLVTNDLVQHRGAWLQKIRDHAVRRLVFTGHSLGGGMAQVAHLAFKGMLHQERAARLADMQELHLASISFGGPMVTFVPRLASLPNNNPTPDVLDQLRIESEVWVVDSDIVPHLPGHPEYWRPALAHLAQAKAPVLRNFCPEVSDAVISIAEVLAWPSETVEELRGFRHVARIFKVDVFVNTRTERPTACVERMEHADLVAEEYGIRNDSGSESAGNFLVTCHSCLPRAMLG